MDPMNNKITNEEIPPSFFQTKNKIKRCPNSPLLKMPFISMRLKCKNLDHCKSYTNNSELFEKQTPSFFYKTSLLSKESVNLNENLINNINNNSSNSNSNNIEINNYLKDKPYIGLSNLQIIEEDNYSTSINHYNPRWVTEHTFNIKNPKQDLILIELFACKKEEEKKKFLSNNNNNTNVINLGFQVIPIRQIERKDKINSEITLRLLDFKPQDYFVNEKKHSLNIDNHYFERYKENEELNLMPLITIKYDYHNFVKLWEITAIVHSIIQREDKQNKKDVYMYKLYCRRNDDLTWFKEVTFDEIIAFRNKICLAINDLKHVPFPNEYSILSKLPFIGKYYSDENNDILIEKKFTLDNFFENVCERTESYGLSEFNDFFGSNE